MKKDFWFIKIEGDIRWMENAACKEADKNLFFPERGESQKITQAQKICDVCEVKNACLEFGLRNREPGIWGGTTGRERRIMAHQKLHSETV